MNLLLGVLTITISSNTVTTCKANAFMQCEFPAFKRLLYKVMAFALHLNNYLMGMQQSDKLNTRPVVVPQRTQVAAWGLGANIAELKEIASQVQREVSQGEVPCNSTISVKNTGSFASIFLTFSQTIMKIEKPEHSNLELLFTNW
jgi:hypothetical protein